MRSKLKKLKKNIAVLMGGYSDEFEISIKSGNNILKNIDTKLFLSLIHISEPTRPS